MGFEGMRAALACGLALAAFFALGGSAESSLASTAYAVLRWLDAADAVHHEIEARIDFASGEASFVDDALFTSEGKRTIHFLLGVDAELQRVEWLSGNEWTELPFGTTFRWEAVPFVVYRVQLPRAVPAGDPFRLRFYWRITPESARFHPPFPAPGFFYLGYPVLWYPQMPNEDYFTATLAVAAPAGYTVIADGEPGEPVREDEWELRRYRISLPVNRLGFGVGRFERAEVAVPGAGGRELRVEAYAPAGAPSTAREAARRAAESIRFFEERLGALPVSRFYVAEVPFDAPLSFSGLHGLVYGGDISLLGLEGSEGLALMAAHETAHKWIGALAGVRVVGSSWFSEGLAEYLGHLALERLVGPEEAARLLERRIYVPFASKLRSGPGRALSAIEIFDDDSQWIFEKGSQVFRMLHHLLGDEAFFALLRAFVAEYEGRHASGADFTRFAVEWAARGQAPAGARELDRFFAAWVRGTGRLDYAVEGVSTTPVRGGHQVQFTVVNLGEAPFPGSVAVLIEGDDGTEVWAESREQTAVVAVLPSPPARIVVDPRRVLADADFGNNTWLANHLSPVQYR